MGKEVATTNYTARPKRKPRGRQLGIEPSLALYKNAYGPAAMTMVLPTGIEPVHMVLQTTALPTTLQQHVQHEKNDNSIGNTNEPVRCFHGTPRGN